MMKKSLLSWSHEKANVNELIKIIAGIDEAGRGCLAGPVVAAAAIFTHHTTWPKQLNDSKKLCRKMRQLVYEELLQLPHFQYGIGLATPTEIDEVNILQATYLAMNRAIQKLPLKAHFFLVDGHQKPRHIEPNVVKCIVKGDSLSPSIAAASVLAKETRDRIMEQAELDYPHYGFKQHKGYGTKKHLHALKNNGACPLHRRSFAPVFQSLSFGHRDKASVWISG